MAWKLNLNGNNTIPILIVLLFSFNIVRGQKIQALYKLTYRPQKEDTLMKKEIVSLIIDMKHKESFFENNNALGDSSQNENAFIFKVYKNFEKAHFFSFQSVLNDYYKTEFEGLNDWKILPGSKVILNYMVFPAKILFGGRNWTAWYTNEISIPDGPYKFHGLPGLILEIEDENKEFIFNLLELKKTEASFRIPKYIEINHHKLEKLKANVLKKPSAHFIQKLQNLKGNNMGFSVSYNNNPINENDIAKQIDEEIWQFNSKHNNPIEKDEIWIR